MHDVSAEGSMPPCTSDRLAADLRAAVSALVRATRTVDELAPIPAAVLDLLERNGETTTAELAARRGVRHQTMAATIKELTEAGYVSASPDPADARKKVLALTATGKNAIDADRRHRIGALAQAVADSLNAGEQRLLARALPLIGKLAQAVAGQTPLGAEISPSSPEPGPVTGAW